MRILVIDVGGTHVKVLATGHKQRLESPSSPRMTPAKMVAAVRAATVGWKYDAVSIGYPGPVVHGRGVVVHDLVTQSIEARCKGHFGDGHADVVGQSLPQGTRCSFEAGGLAVFRMAWRTAAPLAESLEFLQRQVEAGDVKQYDLPE